MKGLIKKDLFNLASYKSTLIFLIIFCGIALFGTGSLSFASLLIGAVVGMISLSTFNYDESSKAEKYILSLPVTKKEIVLSKYILAILSAVFGCVLGMLLSILVVPFLNMIRPEANLTLSFSSLLIGAIGGLFGISLIQSIQIPCIYKWGAERGRIQMFLLLFLVIALVVGGVFLLNHFSLQISMAEVEQFMNFFGIPLLLGLTVFMYYISYRISYRLMLKKDH